MDFDLFFFFFLPPKSQLYTLRNLFSLTLPHAGLACKVVLARAVPKDSSGTRLKKTTPTLTVLFECGRCLHS